MGFNSSFKGLTLESSVYFSQSVLLCSPRFFSHQADITFFFLTLKFVSPCIIIQFKQINQLDATISPVYYLTFIYSSTCFGRPHAPHQELNNCSSSPWFYRWSVVIAVLLVVVGPAGWLVKPEAATAVVELLMIGVRTPEIC